MSRWPDDDEALIGRLQREFSREATTSRTPPLSSLRPPLSPAVTSRRRFAIRLRSAASLPALAAALVAAGAVGTAAVLATHPASHPVHGPTPTAGIPVASVTQTPVPTAAATTAQPPTPAPSPPGGGSVSLSPASFHNDGTTYTAVRFTLNVPATVNIDVYDSAGRLVKQAVVNDVRKAGNDLQDYYGYDSSGHLLPAGRYTVTVSASADGTSASVSVDLTLT